MQADGRSGLFARRLQFSGCCENASVNPCYSRCPIKENQTEFVGRIEQKAKSTSGVKAQWVFWEVTIQTFLSISFRCHLTAVQAAAAVPLTAESAWLQSNRFEFILERSALYL